MKISYVALVYTDDYKALANVLNHSFTERFKSKYPFTLLVTQNVNRSDFSYPIKTIPYAYFENAGRYAGTLNKFWAFNLTEFDYIVFTDVDVFLTQNIDEEVEQLIAKYPNNNFIGKRCGNILSTNLFIAKTNRNIYCDVISSAELLATNSDERILTALFDKECTAETTADIEELQHKLLLDYDMPKLLTIDAKLAPLMIKMTDEDYLRFVKLWNLLKAPIFNLKEHND